MRPEKCAGWLSVGTAQHNLMKTYGMPPNENVLFMPIWLWTQILDECMERVYAEAQQQWKEEAEAQRQAAEQREADRVAKLEAERAAAAADQQRREAATKAKVCSHLLRGLLGMTATGHSGFHLLLSNLSVCHSVCCCDEASVCRIFHGMQVGKVQYNTVHMDCWWFDKHVLCWMKRL